MKIVLNILVLLFSAFNVNASSLEEYMVYQSDYVDGKPVSDYVNIWWQWTYTMPKEVSPVRDLTGEFCNIGQQGDVWFLAGGYGSSKIKRSCTLPEGKHIFFPVINMLYYPRYEGSISCEEAKNEAALNNDELLSIQVQLNDLIAWNPANTRISSERCFDILGRVPRELEPPEVFPAATDGYWVMLKPLPKGIHSLKYKAQYDREKGAYSKMLQDIEYELIVE